MPIPEDEELFRSINIDDLELNREQVLSSAIDLRGMSVDRSKYINPYPPTPITGYTGLALLKARGLPRNVQIKDKDGKPESCKYGAFAMDAPTELNTAHAEIRVGREEYNLDRDEGRKPNSARVKEAMKREISRLMTIFMPPKSSID